MTPAVRVLYLMDAQKSLVDATVYALDSAGPISAGNTLTKVKVAQQYLDKLAADLEAVPKMEAV